MLTNCEDELVLNNFLSILAKDIENCPQNLVPMTVEKFIKIFSLVEDIKIDLETPLDEEDDEWKLFLEDTPPLGTFEKQFSSLTDKNFRSRRLVFVFCFLLTLYQPSPLSSEEIFENLTPFLQSRIRFVLNHEPHAHHFFIDEQAIIHYIMQLLTNKISKIRSTSKGAYYIDPVK